MIYQFSIAFLIMLAGTCNTSQKNRDPERAVLAVSGHSNFSIKGICLVAPVNKIDSEVLDPIIAVNGNSIAIMPYAFCRNGDPEVKYNHNGQWWGETDAGVLGTIQLAHEKNLTVMIKPHLWLMRGGYTGALKFDKESDWEIWEKSYREYILHFAKLGDSMHANIMCIGTELGASIKIRPQYWQSLITDVRKVFSGKVTYAANWDDYANFPFWNQLDYIGVDAYFPLSDDVNAPIAELKRGWERIMPALEKISSKNNRQILFTEIGYRNSNLAGSKPWEEKETERNDVAQNNCYDAFFASFTGKKWFAGSYLWKWYATEGRRRRSDIDFTPQDKPALKRIEHWYGDDLKRKQAP